MPCNSNKCERLSESAKIRR